jgi:predicted RNase H-like HicB family nuclease
MTSENQISGYISVTVHLFKEEGVFVAHVPELNVSSCGDSAEVACRHIKDAVEEFLHTAKARGTLHDILEEAGYRLEGEHWVASEVASNGRMTVSLSV